MYYDPADEILTPTETPVTDNAPLFVSLYVVLLAFFILLNSMSTFETKKVQEVHEGIKKAFVIQKPLNSPEILESQGLELSITQFYSETKELAASLLQLWKVDTQHTGNTISMTMPVDALFKPGQKRVRPESIQFMNQLVKTLTTWRQGLRIDIEFLIGYQAALTDAPGAQNRLDVARAGALARELAASGIPAKSIAGGLSQADPDNISLTFSVRALDKASLNLKPRPAATP